MNGKKRAHGMILKGVGGRYSVDCEGRIYEDCKASGRLRLDGRTPWAGDRVELEIDSADGSGYITALGPRKNAMSRPAIANIDRLFILVSQAPPVSDLYLVDKLTVLAAWLEIEAVIVLSKCDLDRGDRLHAIYTGAGFPAVRVSAFTGEGLEQLSAMLAGKVSAFAGHSGVGKSSVLNRLDSRFGLSVGEISQRIGRGKNTTRHVELLKLENGGLVADTPGFSTFDLARMAYIPKEMLAGLFPEMADVAGRCRFSDCAHLEEPGCAFLSRLAARPELESRHESYRKLYAELGQIKAWEAVRRE